MKSKIIKYIAIAALVGLMSERSSAAVVNVGLELALLVDVSSSVNQSEFTLQRDGYVSAFRSSNIQTLVTTLGQQSGGLAVTYIQWDGLPDVPNTIGWTLLTDAASCEAFADQIAAIAFIPGFGTGVANAINAATPQFAANAFANGDTINGLRQVIDVSGDGRDNRAPDGATSVDAATGAINTAAARDAALAAGVDRINGLPILGETDLLDFYQNNVAGGVGAFTLPVDSFDDFAPAIERKIAAEITNTNPSVPEGGPGLAMTGLLLFGLAGLHRHLARKSV